MAATRSRMMISGLAVACVLWAWGGSQYRSQDSIASKRWTVSTFLEFSRGTLGDAGANTYVTAAGEVKLINLWDLNRDGFIDIVLPNTHDNNEQIDLFIYWDVDENHVGRRTRLPSGGGTGQALGDLNRDGFTDLVVVNGRNGIKSNLDSFIYWGGAQGFDAGRRTELPTLGGMAAAVADLDGDGYPEIVFANSAWAGGRPSGPENASFLYWGSKDGFSIERRQSLPTAAATDVAVADLDRDGSPEVVFANEGSGADLGGAMIYWGGAGGSYAADRRTLLPGQRSSAVALADLNGDRVPEVVLANRYRPLLREPDDRSEWDTDVDSESIRSFVYWGSSGGYSAERRLELPTVAASSVAAGDLNKDGLPDLVFANGPQKSGHAAPGPGSGSPIYWNSAEGFEPRRRTVLPSLNPTDCLIEDLNRDGHPDLVFSNEHNARSHRAPSYVYWGGPAGFDTNRRLELTTLGAAAAGSADFDRDGKADLVFVNRIDGSAGDPVPAYIYWGNEEGKYSVDQRLDLYHPFGSPGEGYSSADIDNDGWVDIYMGGPESAVYWGSPQGFSSTRKTVVSSEMAFSARVADFNRDGYLDLVLSEYAAGHGTDLYWGGPMGFARNHRFTFQVEGVRCQSIADLNGDGWLDVVFPTVNRQLVIFWNGPDGFDNANRKSLPAGLAVATEIADLDGDGWLELLATNLMSAEGGRESDVLVYWGAAGGYEAERATRLPAMGPEGVAVADLNADGLLDIVVTSYHAGETRSHPSYIYWNADGRFDASRVSHIPTHSGSGVMAADFNNDGVTDLLFACHKVKSAHRNLSFLYEGTPQGFSTERRQLLPGLGPHFLAGVDVGHVSDRGDRYDYISEVFDAGGPVRFQTLGWEGETPFASAVEFQVRGAGSIEALRQAAWRGPDGAGSLYAGRRVSLKGLETPTRYLQFKATLVGPNGTGAPVLRSVSIDYR